MEHRWGERIAVRLTVELSCGSSPPVTGLLENVSSSGAFVRTQGRGPPRGPVDVLLVRAGADRRPSARLPAYIVRETDIGVGIEWCEFAPRPVRELLIRDRRSGSARTRARALPSSPYAPREPNTAIQPALEPTASGAASPVVAVTAARG